VDISLRPSAPLSEDLITSCKAVTYRFKSKEDEEKEKAQQQQKKK
jgi:Tfp pilus assembly protein PilO